MSGEGLAGRMLPRPDTAVEANQLGLWCVVLYRSLLAANAIDDDGYHYVRFDWRRKVCRKVWSAGFSTLALGFLVAFLHQHARLLRLLPAAAPAGRAELSCVARCALQVRRHRAEGAPSGAHRGVHRRSELGGLRALHRLGQAVRRRSKARPPLAMSQRCAARRAGRCSRLCTVWAGAGRTAGSTAAGSGRAWCARDMGSPVFCHPGCRDWPVLLPTT
jgi:hypothetical protein